MQCGAYKRDMGFKNGRFRIKNEINQFGMRERRKKKRIEDRYQ